MDKQWWEYGLDILITFGATFAGVTLAIWADNRREKEVQKRQLKDFKTLKEKLIFSLLVEIKGVQKFCFDNEGALQTRSPYSFETSVVESTPEEQIKFIDSKQLLYGLYELREHCRAVHQTIEAFTKPNIDYSYQEDKIWQKNCPASRFWV